MQTSDCICFSESEARKIIYLQKELAYPTQACEATRVSNLFVLCVGELGPNCQCQGKIASTPTRHRDLYHVQMTHSPREGKSIRWKSGPQR